uniref:Uncharacterized protein n=1 Tax=Methanococcus maripaludis (strain C5 / ATCC BAA-1333) TaxID=402880 RepID=O06099_METM5|nr:unknown [Methanococcus maripaludis C5]
MSLIVLLNLEGSSNRLYPQPYPAHVLNNCGSVGSFVLTSVKLK